MRKQPTKPGFVCPHTGRVAVLVRDYANIRGDWWKVSIRTRRAVQWPFALPMGRARRSGR